MELLDQKGDNAQPQIAKSIVLEVGGKIIKTTSDTLKKIGKSKLAGLCNDVVEVPRNPDGSLVIDRDPKIFKHVLTYLNSD